MKRFPFQLSVLCASSILLTASAANAQSFGLDDSPNVNVVTPGFGFGAENPFGWLTPGFPPGYAPSPTLATLPCIDADILGAGPVFQLPTPNGQWDDSITSITWDQGQRIRLFFSVDRVSTGVPGTDVAWQAGLNQQPGDVYRSTHLYQSPGTFVGAPGPMPYGGPLPAPVGGLVSNRLFTDDSTLGLVSGNTVYGPNQLADPIGPGTHDNLEQLDMQLLDANNDGLNDGWYYFTIYPDEAALLGPSFSAADVFDVAPAANVTAPVPYAFAPTMGLDVVGGPNSDSIDALVLYDNNLPGGMNWGGPGAEPAIDYALFTLAPGSASLLQFNLTASDVFFTDFTGKFFMYAPNASLGLTAVTGEPGFGDNIDALEINCSTDIDGNNITDFQDLIRLLAAWGPNPGHPADNNGDGVVAFNDLLYLLNNWGQCS